MKVTYNWLKDFVELKISPQALAEKLTMAGLEVTSLEQKDGDFVFGLEITSNRPDCLSVIGIAREVAAITAKKLKFDYRLAAGQRIANSEGQNFKIQIQNKNDCPLYTAKIIRDVKVGPSPSWLKNRLELIDCRSINNIVDITNYILFTWGEPLHAFDLDKLKGKVIVVRRAKAGEELITLDDQPRSLNPDILVIADRERPIAVAGIMGGKDTEVDPETKNILLEAAVFNPVIVRRGKQHLGAQSDSSYRFERGIDLEIVKNASSQAQELIQKLAGGKYVLAQGSGWPKARRKSIHLNVSTAQKTLGINIAPSQIKKILNSLEFKTRTQTKNVFKVEVPSHRLDVNLEIDLIEEIARIFGFASIPKTQPAVRPQLTTDQSRGLVSIIKNILTGLGLNEVITYSLVDKDLLSHFVLRQESPPLEILNPLSQEQGVLRPLLMPSLAACVAYNLNQKQDYVNIFEVAAAFLPSASGPKEESRLGIALCGSNSLLLEEGLGKETAGFLHLKGIIETLLARLGARDCNFKPRPGGDISVCVAAEEIGFFTTLAKDILDRLGIKNKRVFAAEISLDKLLASIDFKKKFVHLPLYPGISRDISLILKEEILAGDVLEAIRERGRPLLREVRVADYYRGKQIPSGFKGLTISCLYRLEGRTLTETEINPVHSLLCTLLTERFGAQIR